jgi:hypothetical protein
MSVPDDIRALVYALYKLGGGELRRGQAGIRVNLSGLNTGSKTPWTDCFSVDMSVETFARLVKAAEQEVQPAQAPLVAAQSASGTDIDPLLEQDLEEHCIGLDTDFLMSMAAQDPHRAVAAFDEITREGEL